VSHPPARSPARLAAAAVVALLAIAVPGCGSDDEPATTSTTSTATGPTGPEERPGHGSKPDGDAEGAISPSPAPSTPQTTPSTGGETAPPPEDSEENDIPPPAGSPAEQFEQACEENPEICD
jgi:cell division protein FtsN